MSRLMRCWMEWCCTATRSAGGLPSPALRQGAAAAAAQLPPSWRGAAAGAACCEAPPCRRCCSASTLPSIRPAHPAASLALLKRSGTYVSLMPQPVALPMALKG